MKHLFLFFSLIMATVTHAQNMAPEYPVNEQGEIGWSVIEIVDSTLTKQVLFARAQAWISKNYKNPQEVTQVSDITTGFLDVRGNMPVSTSTKMVKYIDMGRYNFTILIKVRDGKYKVEVKNISRTYYTGTYGPYTNSIATDLETARSGKQSFIDITWQFKDTITAMLADLKTMMTAANYAADDF